MVPRVHRGFSLWYISTLKIVGRIVPLKKNLKEQDLVGAGKCWRNGMALAHAMMVFLSQKPGTGTKDGVILRKMSAFNFILSLDVYILYILNGTTPLKIWECEFDC